MSGIAGGLAADVLEMYREIDRKVERVQEATGMGCVSGCGRCCWHPEVEASVLQVLPLALAVYREGREEAVMAQVREKLERADPVCVMFRPDPEDPDQGRCAAYAVRPLLCRLFGFAARRDKYGAPELVTCRVIRERSPDACQRAEIGLAAGLEFPVYQEAFLRTASLDPDLGNRVLPINRAIKEALEYLYWKRPLDDVTPQAEYPKAS